MGYVHVDTPMGGCGYYTNWHRVAVPAPVARRLHAAGLIRLDPDCHLSGCAYLARAAEWGGALWTVRDLIQIPGAFLER